MRGAISTAAILLLAALTKPFEAAKEAVGDRTAARIREFDSRANNGGKDFNEVFFNFRVVKNYMKREFSIAQVFLWLLVIMLGIEIGAGLYETIVVVPMWAGSPPDSLVAYYQHKVANPEMTENAGGKFWIFATPTLGLLSIAVLLTNRRAYPAQRRMRAVGGGLALMVVAFTFAWFVPNIMLLQSAEVLTMKPEQAASLSNWWFWLNWARVVLYAAAWLSALRALTLSPETDFK